MRFEDREGAGRQLAKRTQSCANRADVIALVVPRGGVPIAFEIAGLGSRSNRTAAGVFV